MPTWRCTAGCGRVYTAHARTEHECYGMPPGASA